MHGCAFVTLALAASVRPAFAQVVSAPLPSARTARELSLGVVGGLAGVVAGSNAGRLVGNVVRGEPYRPKHDNEIGDLYNMLGVVLGQSIGSAVGVYYAGRMDKVQDSFGQTLVGATVGEVVGVTVYFAIRGFDDVRVQVPAVAAMVVAAPIGAVIGFNRSRRTAAQSNASAATLVAPHRLFTLRLAF